MDFDHLRYEVADSGVATITLDDPDSRNALSADLLGELIAGLEAARDDERVKCVVLASSHESTFSSGGNLQGFTADTPLVHRHFANEGFPRVFRALGQLGKPSLCAANGHVLAGAMGLALACDLIVAKDTATFGTPEINVGVFPFMVMALLERNVSRKKLAEMVLLGERLSAHEAERLGFVNTVVGEDEFEATVTAWAQKLASKSPVLMKLGKDALYRQGDMAFDDAVEYLRSQLTLALSTEDIQEGVRAFFDKREPTWKGR